MNDIVERVAKAIQEEARNPLGSGMSAARAAIEAMREPTREMRNAGCASLVGDRGVAHADQVDAWHIFRAMIDAALKEPA